LSIRRRAETKVSIAQGLTSKGERKGEALLLRNCKKRKCELYRREKLKRNDRRTSSNVSAAKKL